MNRTAQWRVLRAMFLRPNLVSLTTVEGGEYQGIWLTDERSIINVTQAGLGHLAAGQDGWYRLHDTTAPVLVSTDSVPSAWTITKFLTSWGRRGGWQPITATNWLVDDAQGTARLMLHDDCRPVWILGSVFNAWTSICDGSPDMLRWEHQTAIPRTAVRVIHRHYFGPGSTPRGGSSVAERLLGYVMPMPVEHDCPPFPRVRPWNVQPAYPGRQVS